VDPAWNPAREVRGAAQLADQVHDDCRKRFDDGGKCAAKDECDGEFNKITAHQKILESLHRAPFGLMCCPQASGLLKP